ncbi:MAG: 5-(carboxyamino)imidazole ribonucleotide synthase [Verrucomicrobiota bacterium]
MNQQIFLPPARIGIIGGGQLGRMTAIAARRLGYKILVLDPNPHCPASHVADQTVQADYGDITALKKFAEQIDLITFEFENIPGDVLKELEYTTTDQIFPHWSVLHTCQNREREKLFLNQNRYPLPPFKMVTSPSELSQAIEEIGTPSVLKTADFGYDGKGQIKLTPENTMDIDAVSKLWQELNEHAISKAVLEKWVNYKSELSVVCARSRSGECSTFPVAENKHTNHILDLSIVPAQVPEKVQKQAREMAISIAETLDVIGLIAVEMFFTVDGELLVNECAPRPHNSGHYSLDACLTCQFEQHVRAICNLPLGSTKLLSPVVMVNILGDTWLKSEDNKPDWSQLLKPPSLKLHLYGKDKARAGRKMGHLNIVNQELDTSLKIAQEVKDTFL